MNTSSDIGYRGATACVAAGISYRQLDYWARTGLVEPGVRGAAGSGSQRLYSFRDILVLKIVKRLLDTGVSLQNIRTAVDHLRSRGVSDLESITLMSDGASIYECTSPDEIVDLLQGVVKVFLELQLARFGVRLRVHFRRYRERILSMAALWLVVKVTMN